MVRYLLDSNGEPYTSDTFSLSEYLSSIDPKLLSNSQSRIALTKYNPLLFLLLYLPKMMRSEETGFQLSVNDMNLTLCRHALEWCAPKLVPKRKGLRRAYLAPRGSSKSSTAKGCVLWAASHGHLKYIMLFSGSDLQADKHLASIKQEIDNNELLNEDYPDFCSASRKRTTNTTLSDKKNSYKSKSGVTIEARSITSSVLGAKEGDLRPQLLLMDDVSKGEGSGSTYQSHQRLEVILGTILPLNTNAPVVYLCTNHMIGSIEDQFMKSLDTSPDAEPAQWIAEENFETYWLKPLIERSDGSLRSIWPERWSVEYLLTEQHKRTYQRDMLNLPVPLGSGDWFTQDDFVIDPTPVVSKWVLSIDPGISQKGDPAGVSVIGFSQSSKKAVVYEAMALRLKSVDMKKRIIDLLLTYPGITEVVYEATQGGENLYYATYGEDFPRPVHFVYPKQSKLERAEILLTRYRRRQITHARRLSAYEAEALTLPFYTASPNMVDSVSMGVEWIATAGRSGGQVKIGVKSI